MKLTITHLKAPWPAGAKIGDVIELAEVPAWAAGKCTQAVDGATVTAAFEQVEAEAGNEAAEKPAKGRTAK